MSIGEIIYNFRKLNGIKQYELAVYLGCSNSYLSRIETDKGFLGRGQVFQRLIKHPKISRDDIAALKWFLLTDSTESSVSYSMSTDEL